jgi:Ca2+/H+ antiporter
MCRYIKGGQWEDIRPTRLASTVKNIERLGTPPSARSEAEESEEDEMPDDLKELSPAEQQRAVQVRAVTLMGIGTLSVLVFSDPAVEVLNEIGKRTGIPSFYISFILAPIASNASELVATYKYGCKKTISSMAIALSTLEGAACMNNTFCLLIFYALIWWQSLEWNFSAEVLSIVLVEFAVGVFALKPVHTLQDAYYIASMFPLSLVLVWILNNIVGMP